MFSDESGGDINSMTRPEGICSGYLKHKGIYCGGIKWITKLFLGFKNKY